MDSMNIDPMMIDLAAERLGGEVVYASDEFFAEAANLLRHDDPVWKDGVFTERGKWMDGWESRRRRGPGHDVCVIRLGAPGRVREAVVETTHFKGNQPEACAIDGLSLPEGAVEEGIEAREDWGRLLDRSPLAGDSVHRFATDASRPVTHVRFHIFPDGGVARLRLFGEVEVDWSARIASGAAIDLAALVNGGTVIESSDEAFGVPENLLLPGRARTMGEGWETRRRRGPGHDWVVIRLGHRGVPERVEICTEHFKGNFPAAASVESCDAPGGGPDAVVPGGAEADAWRPLLPQSELSADSLHVYDDLAAREPATHVRLAIYPDGGVARFHVIGRPVDG